mgnify:CR=1 FL=1
MSTRKANAQPLATQPQTDPAGSANAHPLTLSWNDLQSISDSARTSERANSMLRHLLLKVRRHRAEEHDFSFFNFDLNSFTRYVLIEGQMF